MNHLVIANWKMHMTGTQAAAFLETFLDQPLPDVDVVIAPPATAIAQVAWRLRGTSIGVGGQDMYWEPSGAFTGAISAPMLIDAGATFVILGHSERRKYFGETDAGVNRKVRSALENGLTPVICVGESADEREAGRAIDRVVAQTRAALDGLDAADASRVVMAYEPLWAIGSGKNCDAADADATMGAIRGSVPGLERARVLYGGSVKPENVAAYSKMPNNDGGLVGGASLDPVAFAALIRAAQAGSA